MLAALFCIVGCGPGAQALLEHVQGNPALPEAYDWTGNPVLVVLGAGTELVGGEPVRYEPGALAYGRLAKAADLYRQCRAAGGDCTILVSGGDIQKRGATEARVYADELLRIGVPAASIVVESKSHNTWENAKFSAAVLNGRHPSRVVLVTSGVHVRRGLAYFAHFGIRAIPARSDYLSAIPSWLPAAYNFTMADIAIHEIIGMYRFHTYNRLGLNEKPKL